MLDVKCDLPDSHSAAGRADRRLDDESQRHQDQERDRYAALVRAVTGDLRRKLLLDARPIRLHSHSTRQDVDLLHAVSSGAR